MPEVPRNPLSCTRCKVKKIKCGREEPTCDKCSATKSECTYPTRRKKARSAKKRVDILFQILQRLDALEKKVGVTVEERHLAGGAPSIDETDTNILDDDDNTSDSEDAHTDSETPLKSLYQLMNEAASNTKTVFEQVPEDTPDNPDTDDIFSNALNSIRSFRWKDDHGGDAAENLDIPDEVAYKWIELCFQITFYEQLIGLSNKPLMMAMPNIMKSSEVHVNYSVIVVYYIALFCGWRSDENSMTPRWNGYGRKIYRKLLKILPLWKNDGLPPTAMDVVGTGLLTMLAIENFDYHLAWDIHLACCGLARDLKLDKLDDPNLENRPKGYEDEDEKNSMRKKFWEIIHIEFFFRLYYDKPPSMTRDGFSVNLPTIEPAHGSKHKDDTIYFLVSSRNVFNTKEFFDVLEKPGDDFRDRVNALQEQTENILIEWNIHNSLGNTGDNLMHKWVYADLLINGYITIILMDRKASAVRGEVATPSTKSVCAARRVLETIKQLSTLYSHRSPTFMNFISFYPFVAFFTLYHHILHQLRQRQRNRNFNLDEVEADVSLMEDLAGVLRSLAPMQEEFRLVANAVTALTKASRHVLSTSLPNTPVSVPTPTGAQLRTRPSTEQVSKESTIGHEHLSFPWTSTDGSAWPQFEAGYQQNGLQTPLHYVESMENDLFGRNWHQSWWDQ